MRTRRRITKRKPSRRSKRSQRGGWLFNKQCDRLLQERMRLGFKNLSRRQQLGYKLCSSLFRRKKYGQTRKMRKKMRQVIDDALKDPRVLEDQKTFNALSPKAQKTYVSDTIPYYIPHELRQNFEQQMTRALTGQKVTGRDFFRG